MKISIIIPAYREAGNIARLIQYLKKYGKDTIAEIIVVDGGSDDNTLMIAAEAGAIALPAPAKGRGAQMNFGAIKAKADVLYFVHADVFPPPTFATDILSSIEKGFDFGRYTMKFDSNKWYLRINTFFTRFDFFVCYGGDQTLFITRELYNKSGGFRADLRIMEDFEFTQRAKKFGRYRIIKKGALISARKYDTNSWWKVQKANKKIVDMYKKGATQDEMVDKYREILNYR